MSGPDAFYSTEGLNAATYDSRTTPDSAPVERDVAFYLAEAERTGTPVLELGSGTGRVAWPLAAAGFEVVGLDASLAMLHRAEAKAANHPEEVRRRARFVHGDMREFSLDMRFALVVIPFRAFQSLLTPADQRRCLACIRHHLRPRGRLIIDLFDPRLEYCYPEAPTPMQPEEGTHPESGNRVRVRIASHTNDPVRQVLVEDWCFTEIAEDGHILREQWERLELRWTYRQEARHLWELSGFEVEAEYSDFRRSPPAYGGEQIWVLRPR